MTYGYILSKFNLSFKGFWDSCFFTENTKSGGIIVWDWEKKQERCLTWFEFYKLADKVKGITNETTNK